MSQIFKIIIILLLQIKLSNTKSNLYLRKLVSGNSILIGIIILLTILIVAGIVVAIYYKKRKKQEKGEIKIQKSSASNHSSGYLDNFTQDTKNSIPYSNTNINILKSSVEFKDSSPPNNSEILKNRISSSFNQVNNDIDNLKESKISSVKIKNLD